MKSKKQKTWENKREQKETGKVDAFTKMRNAQQEIHEKNKVAEPSECKTVMAHPLKPTTKADTHTAANDASGSVNGSPGPSAFGSPRRLGVRTSGARKVNSLTEVKTESVCGLEDIPEREELAMTVDSGAGATVVNDTMTKIVAAKNPRPDIIYEVADGSHIPNMVERRPQPSLMEGFHAA